MTSSDRYPTTASRSESQLTGPYRTDGVEPTIAGAIVTDHGAVICYTKCWPCSFGQCPGGEHRWADDDDIEHAAGRPETAEGVCGCPCARGPVLDEEPPDLDDCPLSLDAPPCPVCGESGACSYDPEGRPLIHAITEDDE